MIAEKLFSSFFLFSELRIVGAGGQQEAQD